ncbi:MAG: HAD family hydrolase [Ruminococcaceae bacterium]|nr:HAD family hydrolase [Oscillospiraceae bacterium]
MIKLIASDLDGTLLDDEKHLPSDFFEVFDELERRRIQFAVASGRTYSAVGHLFPEEYRSKITFICDNGACVIKNGKTLHTKALDRETYEELLTACAEIGGLKPIVCAESGIFHLGYSEDFRADVSRYYLHHSAVENLYVVPDPIYKFTVRDDLGPMINGKPALDKIFGDRLNIQVSGDVWIDIMASGVSKGEALTALQKSMGITRAETMAFGDYFNDVEMLQNAEFSVCPENAHDEIKQMSKLICVDCNHNGVTECIKKVVFEENL